METRLSVERCREKHGVRPFTTMSLQSCDLITLLCWLHPLKLHLKALQPLYFSNIFIQFLILCMWRRGLYAQACRCFRSQKRGRIPLSRSYRHLCTTRWPTSSTIISSPDPGLGPLRSHPRVCPALQGRGETWLHHQHLAVLSQLLQLLWETDFDSFLIFLILFNVHCCVDVRTPETS